MGRALFKCLTTAGVQLIAGLGSHRSCPCNQRCRVGKQRVGMRVDGRGDEGPGLDCFCQAPVPPPTAIALPYLVPPQPRPLQRFKLLPHLLRALERPSLAYAKH